MEKIVDSNGKEIFIYTEEQLMARLKFFIGVCLALTLTGIVFVVLYSLIFVTQPMNAMAPIDQKFFELIIPIATFLTGTLSGIMLAGKDKTKQSEPPNIPTLTTIIPDPVKPAPVVTNSNPADNVPVSTNPAPVKSSLSSLSSLAKKD